MKKIILEFQHFHGCPNGTKLLERVKKAIADTSREVVLKEKLVDTEEKASKIGFLGSPTILINGEDLEGQSKLLNARLSCRFYQNGLPTVEQIMAKLAAH